MSSKLKKLIHHYEEEKSRIVGLLDSCVEEAAYSKAHLYSKSLLIINQQLQTLYNLNDSLYDTKEHTIRMIKLLEDNIGFEEPVEGFGRGVG